MKNILPILILSAVAAQAQLPPLPAAATGTNAATGRQQALERALQEAVARRSNALSTATSGTNASTPVTSPLPAPPLRPGSIVVPSDATTSNALPTAPDTNAATGRQPAPERALQEAAARRSNALSTATSGTNASTPVTSPLPAPPLRPGSIVVPSDATRSSALPAATTPGVGPAGAGSATNEPVVAITPSPTATNLPPEEIIPAGMIDFRGVDLAQVLTIYADLVNRTILRPANLAAAQQIVLTTRTPLTKREAIQALDAVLGLNGIAMINMGDKFVKAVPVPQANQEGAPWSKLTADQLPDLGQYVTHVVQLKYVKPTEMVQVLTPFAKMQNSILPIDSSQILVLRDYTENVKRMLELTKEIDVAVPAEFISEVIPIKYAKATEIASALNSLSTGGGGATVGGSTTGGGTTRGTMGSRMGGGYGAGGAMGTRVGYGSTFGQQPGMNPYGTTGQMPGQTATPGGTFQDRLQNIIRKAAVSGEIQVLGQTKMIADERSNSLLIYASREDMKTIKEIISKLDVVLAQVLIEAVIIQVSLDDQRELGFGYLQQKNTQIGDFTGIGAINPGKSLSFDQFANSGTNGIGGLPGGLSYLGRFGGDLDVTVTALASDSRAKILQRPRIQTSHNEPAHLFVGESRPYPTGSYYGGGAYGGYSSIQAVPIGVTLEVTPLINPDGLVVMEINQDIQSENGEVAIANVGNVPITSQKNASSKVSVRDRDTIMLGGLIDTETKKSASGVPYLKDIPLLGYLFRSTSSHEIRTEIVVLIRPTVLPTPEVASLTARAEKDKMPLIKKAEYENDEAEAARLKAADRELEQMKRQKQK